MCGIAAVIQPSVPGSALAERAVAIRERLAHRGPDGAGLWTCDGVALAHRRLAMLDPAGGAQPMHSPDGRYTVVFDGEITNHAELRHELEDRHRFRTRSDTEVLAAAWSEWGEAALPRLNGMFAFVVWDRAQRIAVAARDRLGIKPLVWRTDAEGAVLIASEAKAIAPPAPKARLDAVLEYFTAPAFSGVSRLPIAGIEAVPAGGLVRFGSDAPRTDRWIEVFAGDASYLSAEDATEQLREALIPAIQRTMSADVPVATYLSGGFDSTLITATAQRAAPDSMHSYSVSFEQRHRFDAGHSRIVISDDEPVARAASVEIGVATTYVDVTDGSLAGRLKRVIATNDRLPAWEQELAQDALAVAASADYRAVLVGDAADETHMGYQFLLDDAACSSPEVVLRRFADPPIRPDVMTDPVRHFAREYSDLIAAAGHESETPEQRRAGMTHLIVARWLGRLLHNGDIHAMASGVESRVPFGDVHLVELAQRVSPSHGFEDGLEKALLRSAAVGLLPESNRMRTKSALPKAALGWTAYRAVLAEQWESAGDVLSPVLDMAEVERLVKRDNPDEREQGLLFRMASLVLWFDHHGVSW